MSGEVEVLEVGWKEDGCRWDWVGGRVWRRVRSVEKEWRGVRVYEDGAWQVGYGHQPIFSMQDVGWGLRLGNKASPNTFSLPTSLSHHSHSQSQFFQLQQPIWNPERVAPPMPMLLQQLPQVQARQILLSRLF